MTNKVSMEEILAPWLVSAQHVVRELKGPEEELPDGFIEWGGESDFKEETFRERAGNPGGDVKFDKPDEPERERIGLSEEGREWTDYRVNMLDDANAYVIDRRTDGRMGFSGPEPSGSQWLFTFHVTSDDIEKGHGQEPPRPPRLIEMGENV